MRGGSGQKVRAFIVATLSFCYARLAYHSYTFRASLRFSVFAFAFRLAALIPNSLIQLSADPLKMLTQSLPSMNPSLLKTMVHGGLNSQADDDEETEKRKKELDVWDAFKEEYHEGLFQLFHAILDACTHTDFSR